MTTLKKCYIAPKTFQRLSTITVPSHLLNTCGMSVSSIDYSVPLRFQLYFLLRLTSGNPQRFGNDCNSTALKSLLNLQPKRCLHRMKFPHSSSTFFFIQNLGRYFIPFIPDAINGLGFVNGKRASESTSTLIDPCMTS